MDILLTHDQQGDAIDAALKRCVADKELSPAHEIAAESCRAQLQKVVKWANAENMNKDAAWEANRTDARLKYAEVQMDKGDLWIDFVSYEALRAAGGE